MPLRSRAASRSNAVLRVLASPGLAVATLLALFVLTVSGTLCEAAQGLYAARRMFFGSWFFFAGPVPVPGAQTVCAVLVVLWYAALLHARPARFIGETGLAAGSVVGGVVVLFAWLGVNLLGVGLHSYGWMGGTAGFLAATAVAESLFLVVVLAVIGSGRARRFRPSPPPPEAVRSGG